MIAGRVDDGPNIAAQFDLRGCWAEPFMGPSAYTHRLTPNSSAPDEVGWCPGGYADDPNLPCIQPTGPSISYWYVGARSWHPGGVNVLFGDGHVSVTSDAIFYKTWRSLGSIADRQVIQVE